MNNAGGKYQYYYKVDSCVAAHSSADNCICWHNEGTGLYPDARHTDESRRRTWREYIKPTAWSGWATQYPGKLPKLWGTREIAELNFDGENGQRIFMVAEFLKPSIQASDVERAKELIGRIAPHNSNAVSWNPQNERPRDGEHVVYRFEPFGTYHCGVYDSETDSVAGGSGFTSWAPEVTQWYPIPERQLVILESTI